ncbi:amidohydrolase family protein [Leadbettera azotonutricia]|uniref:Amidohydrolase 2 n=1 Tax=Leadbettera azotonutricia (strain ATCC BAA-888 / DSM 13862 / ZAS-9) TaxID=545695 RepID=F5YCE5_LEAAZ|nr:amidohydrolase family protein [Leadbettera azotonutricia]AEF81371.1 amidohydrolase 2 [Leadbettera azotonutricia ZAS-9]
MLDFGIIDTHLHLWDLDKLHYPWLKDNPFLNRTFTLKEYRAACGDIKIDKMVFVQCEVDASQYKEEAAWITELAKNVDPGIAGIVPWAPLEKGAAVEEDLAEFAKNPLVKGIRRIIEFEDDIDFCLRPGFIEGLNLLPTYGFSFDINISFRHNRNVIKMLEKIPEVPCILDHIGKPPVKAGTIEPWKSEIKRMAEFPNLFCKVSSLATEADHKNWTIDDLRPFTDAIFEAFGFERTAFAGDWPVSSRAASYPQCVETLLTLVKGASRADLYKLFRKNGEDFYRI